MRYIGDPKQLDETAMRIQSEVMRYQQEIVDFRLRAEALRIRQGRQKPRPGQIEIDANFGEIGSTNHQITVQGRDRAETRELIRGIRRIYSRYNFEEV